MGTPYVCEQYELGIGRTIDELIDHLERLKAMGIPGTASVQMEGDPYLAATAIRVKWGAELPTVPRKSRT